MPEFSSDVIAAVLNHMNEDHPEDSLLIARAFANTEATSATMTGLDNVAGFWDYELAGETRSLSVPWTAPISERPEIRREIVVLYDRACERLGIEPRAH